MLLFGLLQKQILPKRNNANKIKSYINGSTDWSLTIKASEQNQANDIFLQSDLNGLAVSLPKPLGKNSKETKPFILKTTLLDSKIDHIEITYDEKLNSYIDIDNTNNLISAQITHGFRRQGGHIIRTEVRDISCQLIAG